jgi:dTDP-4-dehydrorhamnose 3,5-epimerase
LLRSQSLTPLYTQSVDSAPLTPKDLLEEVGSALTRQSYAGQPSIEGTTLGELPVFRGPDGLFAELARLDADLQVQGFAGFRPVQWNWSQLQPGAVKAWHVHLEQDDLWIVPPDAMLLVGLVDLRRHSPTASHRQRLTLGAGRCHRLLIPRGVAHGVANLGSAPQTMLYAVNQHFTADPEGTDEWRLPWDHFGPRFWEMDKG